MDHESRIVKEVERIDPLYALDPVEESQWGRCNQCGEMAELSDPCCNSAIWFEGDLVWPEAICDDE